MLSLFVRECCCGDCLSRKAGRSTPVAGADLSCAARPPAGEQRSIIGAELDTEPAGAGRSLDEMKNRAAILQLPNERPDPSESEELLSPTAVRAPNGSGIVGRICQIPFRVEQSAGPDFGS